MRNALRLSLVFWAVLSVLALLPRCAHAALSADYFHYSTSDMTAQAVQEYVMRGSTGCRLPAVPSVSSVTKDGHSCSVVSMGYYDGACSVLQMSTNHYYCADGYQGPDPSVTPVPRSYLWLFALGVGVFGFWIVFR